MTRCSRSNTPLGLRLPSVAGWIAGVNPQEGYARLHWTASASAPPTSLPRPVPVEDRDGLKAAAHVRLRCLPAPRARASVNWLFSKPVPSWTNDLPGEILSSRTIRMRISLSTRRLAKRSTPFDRPWGLGRLSVFLRWSSQMASPSSRSGPPPPKAPRPASCTHCTAPRPSWLHPPRYPSPASPCCGPTAQPGRQQMCQRSAAALPGWPAPLQPAPYLVVTSGGRPTYRA
jgi:hypothetical protein